MNSLYIHIPFCEKKCLYCSFVVAIGQEHRMNNYIDCLKLEAQNKKGKKLKSVYIGGGTPSHLQHEQLESLIRLIKENFKFSSNAEITLEANPEDIDHSKAKLIYELGINRISLGIQSLNNKYLRFLGRCHDAQKAIRAFHIIREEGFQNINVDLMYSFPDQTMAEIEDDVTGLTRLNSEHVSLYTLTIEPNSRFYTQNLKESDGEKQWQHYQCVKKLLGQKSFQQYEVSNFAKQGFNSLHNINYWKGGNYIGLGVGAHSHCDGKRSWNVSNIYEYMKRINNNADPVESSEVLTDEERLHETMLLEMRMNKGTNLKRLENRFHCYLNEDKIAKIDYFIENNFFLQKGSRIKATDQGRLVLDEISAQLI